MPASVFGRSGHCFVFQDLSIQPFQNLLRSLPPAFRSAVHEARRIAAAMLPGKKDVAHRRLLRPDEARELPNGRADITALRERVAGPVHPGHFAVELLGGPFVNLLPFRQENVLL